MRMVLTAPDGKQQQSCAPANAPFKDLTKAGGTPQLPGRMRCYQQPRAQKIMPCAISCYIMYRAGP